MESLPASAAPFRSAFERYEQPLIRYAMRIVHDRERARDIVQDTFLRMYESDVSADDPRLGSWLFTVCRNRAIDVRRREGRLSSLEHSPEVSVDARGEHDRAVNEVFDLVDDLELPAKKATVLELRYRQGQSYRQIADATGMTVSHVGVVIHDCIRMLRKNLAVVAAFALLIGAGAWGVLSSRAPAPEPSYFSQDELALPMVEAGELPPAPGELYGPEEFYGPELPEEIETRRLERRYAPRAAPRMPMAAPAKPPPMRMPNRVDMLDAYDSSL